ncbi:uncharacterized protein LOC123924543 [Trifolium pratense]|uniref:uncharacterized protein LOC123924543 n=1 Tax=Trifolium pratense TaxID=57577 RepID=UPI001E691EB2|nr:uncharacterized protein LOC123924543 [Trifolium pratense]
MMKKQRKSSSSSPLWSESEIEIAEIIRDLYCISLLSSIPFTWGCKRKRSAIQNTPSAALLPRPSKTIAVKTEAPSPETPLSFPATESDDKPKHSKKKTSLKKEKDESLQTIQKLTKSKSSLNQEIEKVQQHYDRLMSINLKLKVRKQQLLCNNSKEPKSELKTLNLEIDQKLKVQLENQSNGSVNLSKSTAENEEHGKNQQHQQQLIQMFPSHETVSLAVASSSSSPSSVTLGRTMNNGPIALPDLNLPTEELMNVASFQPFDEATTSDRAIVAAQARHRRLEIFRLKKPFGNNSKQHQC